MSQNPQRSFAVTGGSELPHRQFSISPRNCPNLLFLSLVNKLVWPHVTSTISKASSGSLLPAFSCNHFSHIADNRSISVSRRFSKWAAAVTFSVPDGVSEIWLRRCLGRLKGKISDHLLISELRWWYSFLALSLPRETVTNGLT